jgi:hypothetical protein
MADGSLTDLGSLKAKVSSEEWRTRVELAALYRLVALYGWDDMIFTHISARIPGTDHHFLINPYGPGEDRPGGEGASGDALSDQSGGVYDPFGDPRRP